MLKPALVVVALIAVCASASGAPQNNEIVTPVSANISPGQTTSVLQGVTPAIVRHAYGFDQIQNKGVGQSIAVVVAFDNPHVQDDLTAFDQTLGVPECKDCLITKTVDKDPDSTCDPPLPSDVQVWQFEASLDVEWAHAIAPDATIFLVEAFSDCLPDLLKAVDNAPALTNASVVSMSWGVSEKDLDGNCRDHHFVATNVSFVAATGDFGHPTLWPAISPDVTAVGGTNLNTNSKGDYSSEISWAGSGGGLSQCSYFPSSQYQLGITLPNNPSGKRSAPDVSINAQFVVVYSSVEGGWVQLSGTSADAPQWAALIAIANSLRVNVFGTAPLTAANPAIYKAAASFYMADFNDITSGPMNGKCGSVCKPGAGYDYLTGLGTPKANALIQDLAKF
jgi:subtilase family serine protease